MFLLFFFLQRLKGVTPSYTESETTDSKQHSPYLNPANLSPANSPTYKHQATPIMSESNNHLISNNNSNNTYNNNNMSQKPHLAGIPSIGTIVSSNADSPTEQLARAAKEMQEKEMQRLKSNHNSLSDNKLESPHKKQGSHSHSQEEGISVTPKGSMIDKRPMRQTVNEAALKFQREKAEKQRSMEEDELRRKDDKISEQLLKKPRSQTAGSRKSMENIKKNAVNSLVQQFNKKIRKEKQRLTFQAQTPVLLCHGCCFFMCVVGVFCEF